MAISFVGSGVGTQTSTTATTFNFTTGLLTAAGAVAVPAVGDLLIVNSGHAGTAQHSAGVTNTMGSGGTLTNAHTVLFQTGTHATTQLVQYKFLTQADITNGLINIPGVAATGNGSVHVVHLFRGVAQTGTLDVASGTTATPSTGVPNARSITPVTAGTMVLACGAGAMAAGAALTIPTGASATTNHFRQGVITTTTNDPAVATALYPNQAANTAIDPATFGGGSTATTGSNTSVSIALRPEGVFAINPVTISSPAIGTPSLVQNTAMRVAGTETVTWDAASKGPNVVLSNNNLTASRTAPNADQLVRSTTQRDIGYAEITINQLINNIQVGVLFPSQVGGSTYLGSSVNSIGWGSGDGVIFQNNASVQTIATYGTSDVLSILVQSNKIWYAKNGVWQNGDPNANPPTGGVTLGAVYTPAIAVKIFAPGDQVTVNFGATAFAYPALASDKGWMVRGSVAIASPVLDTPTLTTGSNTTPLSINSVTIGSPVLGAPGVVQTQALAINAVSIGSPAVGPVTLTGTTPLTITGVTIGSPAYSGVAVTQKHSLSIGNFSIASMSIGPVALGGSTGLTINSVAIGSPVAGPVTLGGKHSLAITGAAMGSPIIGQLTTGQNHIISINNAAMGSPVLGTPALGGATDMPLNLGMNMAGGSAGGTGGYFSSYYYPQVSEMNYLQGQGVKSVRIAFMCFRVYDPATGQLLPDSAYLQQSITDALARFDAVFVEAHDYGQWIPSNNVLDSTEMPAYIDMMVKLLTPWKTNPKVIPSFQNEPANLGTDSVTSKVVPFNQQFITGMRNAGFTGDLCVIATLNYDPLRDYNNTGTANRDQGGVMTLMNADPLKKLIFEGHQYFDDNFSGTNYTQVMNFTSTSQITQASVDAYMNNLLANAVTFARANGIRYHIGEIALPDDPKGTAAWPFLVRWLYDRRDVFVYVSWWQYTDWFNIGNNGYGFSNGSSGGSILMTRLVAAYQSLPGNVDSTAPSILSPSVHSAWENGTYSATALASENVTWSKSGTDAGVVTLNAATGVWSIPAQNYEALGASKALSFILTATDQAGNATPQTITVNIMDLPEGGAPFLPSQIAAAKKVFHYDFSDSSSLTMSGTAVQAVVDKFGLRNLTVPAGKEPEYSATAILNSPGIITDNDQLTGSMSGLTNNMQFFALLRYTGGNTNDGRIFSIAQASSPDWQENGFIYYIRNDNSLGLYQDWGNRASWTAGMNTSPHIVQADVNTTLIENKVDGLRRASGSFTPDLTNTTRFAIANNVHDATEPCHLAIAEVLCFKNLTDLEKIQVEGYLAWRSRGGATNQALLDSGHPYKSVAPTTGGADVQPPTITSPATHAVSENSPYSATATADENVTWTKGGADAGIITLNGTSGAWSMPAQDYEALPANAKYRQFTLTATDGAGNTSTQTITVNVTDVANEGVGGVQATGGTKISKADGYTYHYFDTVGAFTFDVTAGGPMEWLVQGGGGCGYPSQYEGAGGGGAGGHKTGSGTVAVGSYTGNVGAGGDSTVGNGNGGPSNFSTFTSVLGGGAPTREGGSGGGNYGGSLDQIYAAVAGTAGQGYAGGAGYGSSTRGDLRAGGGGGGAGGVGQDGTSGLAGNGGPGVSVWGQFYGGGGGGARGNQAGGQGSGGSGIGGAAAYNGPAGNGAANTGSGGGSAAGTGVEGKGGSGRVVIRYLTSGGAATSHTLSIGNVSIGNPVMAGPTVGQRHTLSVNAVAIGSPVIGGVALSQKQTLTPNGFSIGSPAVQPVVLQSAGGIFIQNVSIQPPVTGTPVLSQSGQMGVNNLVMGSPVISTVQLNGTHKLNPVGALMGSPVVLPVPFSVVRQFTIPNFSIATMDIGRPLIIQQEQQYAGLSVRSVLAADRADMTMDADYENRYLAADLEKRILSWQP